MADSPYVPPVKTATDNLGIWSKVQATDPKYTKKFNRGGGFSGTSTNATWLAKQATKTFGPMGIGWGIKILDESIMNGANEDKIHRVKIELWYKWDGQHGSIEHFGLTTFVGKNKHGLFTDEEAAKKSLTDAMSKALSLLGFAADVHLGMYDDNKYVNAVEAHFIKQEEAAKAERRAAAADASKTDAPSDGAHKDNPVQAHEDHAPEQGQASDQTEDQAPEDPWAGLTEEQREIVKTLDAATEISHIMEYMLSPEVQAILKASNKVDEARLKLHGKVRLKALGHPGKRPPESLGPKADA